MFRVSAVVLLAIYVISPANAKTKRCTLRVHGEANVNDGSVFATPVTTPITGKNIYIEKIPTVSERDVAAFRSYPAANGGFGAVLQFDEHGRLALETLSIQKPGSTVVVLINGRAAAELLVDRRVSDGQIYIASGLTAIDIESMRKSWPQIGAKKAR